MEEVKLEKPENNYGGKRDGSGRKPKAKLKGKFNAREELYKWIDERWDTLTAGVAVNFEDKDMIKYLIDQRIGKAPQNLNLGNQDGEVLKITVIPYVSEGSNNQSP